MIDSKINERIAQYLSFKNMTAKTLEKVCKLGNGTIMKLSEKTRESTIDRIISQCPDLNRDWLITGEGEMLNKKEENSIDFDDYSEMNQKNLQGIYREDEVPERFISYLVPLSAMGGSLSGFDVEGVRRENCERVVSPIADIDWVVPVCGDSMEPEYPNGSRVYVRRIDPGDFIAWGNVFVLDTTNGLIIKVVVESEKANCVRCVSLNPSGRYTPFDVPLRAIRAMYRVMLCVSVK